MRDIFNKSTPSAKRTSLRPNLLMGQHFLRSPAVLKKIIAAANLSKMDTVLEIGPGTGALTLELAQRVGRVVAVEKDKPLATALEEKLKKQNISNVQLITGDILKIQISKFLNFSISYKVVANIPYYLTGRLIRMFLSGAHPPQKMILMVQREVAERIMAKPPRSNILAVAVQTYARPKILFAVPPEAFDPAPRVDSAVIRIENISQKFFAAHQISPPPFFTVVRAAFRGRRKTIENSLSRNLNIAKAEVVKAAAKLGLSGKRPEALTLEDWARLTQALPIEVGLQ